MINISVVTPEGTIYTADDVTSITAPTAEGIITILEDHAPILSMLEAGELVIEKDKNTVNLAVSSGVLHIGALNEVQIMADTAERAEEIDLERAEAARAYAEKLIADKENLEDVQFAQLMAKIQKEMARIGVARRRSI